jgi:ParB family chromosome partitioning protein
MSKQPSLDDFAPSKRRNREAVASTVIGSMAADAQRIPLDKIKGSQYQVRSVDESYIEDLMESITDTKGLISPIIVRQVGENYELIAGHTRTEACRRLGYADIPAVVRTMSDEESAKALAADNVTRKDLSDFELYKQIALLFAHGFLKSNSEASRLLGKTRQDIIRYQAYGKLPQEVINLLEKQPALIGANIAKDLADLSEQGNSVLVSQACEKLFDGHIKNQGAIILWIHQRLAESPVKQEFKVLDGNGKIAGRVLISASGIKVSGKKFDMLKIAEHLKTTLPSMLRGQDG